MAETRIRLDKQIQKASKVNQFPLSDANGELQYADLNGVIKAGETLTRLDSVEIVGGDLIIKYTAEDGQQQVRSTKLQINQTDINVADAKLENPSAGVYRLLLTETDGTTYPVDLSALLAVVTSNTNYITLSGNGTPGTPLRADPTTAFFNLIPKVLDNLNDCTVTNALIDEQAAKPGDVVLVWDRDMKQWVPRSSSSMDNYREITETFPDLRAGNIAPLQYRINQLVPQSIKVFRNGLRQLLGVDYTLGRQGEPDTNEIVFSVPFKDSYPETIIVDYRPLPNAVLA
ncbi:MAG: hypothetical protein BGO70_16530 [Bacteroidetes bacterium 43-93]|nr:hypothetical protein [Bacteroidota bacterium]OJX01369.1 MAG: hypothetical protein BGO70_16530 [Bacteroidetes bacterium 43-93]